VQPYSVPKFRLVTDTSQIFIDLVNSMPIGSDWYFQVSSVHKEFFASLEGVPYEPGEGFLKFILLKEHREKVASLSLLDLHEFIQQATVFWQGRKIFDAYDGFVMNIVSRDFEIKDTPLAKHMNQDILFVSSEW
jgi:hypothetical protein